MRGFGVIATGPLAPQLGVRGEEAIAPANGTASLDRG